MRFYIFYILIVFSSQTIFSTPQGDQAKTLATIGSHTITLDEFSNRYSNYLFSTGVKDNIVARQSILNNMINEILLYYYDTNDLVFSNPDYKKELEETRVRVILGYLKDQEVYANIKVSDEECRQAFLRVNEKISARHLYAPTLEEANELYELLNIGVSFDSLAKQVFTDSTLKNNGGYIGYFTWGDMDQAFEDAAYSMKIGEISKPVKTATGYSIIKVEDRNSNPLLTETEYLNKKSQIEQVLKIRKKTPSEKEYLSKIFNSDDLSFNEDELNKILAKLYTNQPIENNQPVSEECARYKDKIYSRAEIEERINNLPEYHKEKIISLETLKAAIEGLLINETLYSIAVDKGYDKTAPVLDRIEAYKQNIFVKYKIDEIISGTSLPDSVISEYYNRNIHEFTSERELNIQEILVDNQNLADSLKTLVSNGSDFGNLAKEFSLRKWSAKNDGIMGFIPVSKLGSYSEFFWNAEVGEIIGPVKIDNLFGVFRILGKNDSKPIEFSSIKDEITKAAQFENQTEIVLKHLETLKNKVDVKINRDLLGSFNVAG